MGSDRRINWIDEARGWGILCIIFAHVSQYFPVMSSVNGYVCSFHVPIFFVLAGCMDSIFSSKRLNIRKRTHELLVPYAIFSCINIMVKLLVLGVQGQITKELLQKELIEFFITGNGTVWFLLTLWLMNMASDVIKRMPVKKWIMVVAALILLIALYELPSPVNPMLILLYRFVGALGYWGIGYGLYDVLMNKGFLGMKALVLLGAGMCIYMTQSFKIDFFSGIFYHGVAAISASICSSLGFIFLFIFLDKEKICRKLQQLFGYFGKQSLILMLVHPLLLQCVMYPFGAVFENLVTTEQIIWMLGIYIAMIMVQIPIIRIINKYFGFLIGRRK